MNARALPSQSQWVRPASDSEKLISLFNRSVTILLIPVYLCNCIERKQEHSKGGPLQWEPDASHFKIQDTTKKAETKSMRCISGVEVHIYRFLTSALVQKANKWCGGKCLQILNLGTGSEGE
jgi:hypothetical protein